MGTSTTGITKKELEQRLLEMYNGTVCSALKELAEDPEIALNTNMAGPLLGYAEYTEGTLPTYLPT